MTVTAYDEVMYMGYICTVEHTWNVRDGANDVPFAAIRPTRTRTGTYSGEVSGTFYVEQAALAPVPRTV